MTSTTVATPVATTLYTVTMGGLGRRQVPLTPALDKAARAHHAARKALSEANEKATAAVHRRSSHGRSAYLDRVAANACEREGKAYEREIKTQRALWEAECLACGTTYAAVDAAHTEAYLEEMRAEDARFYAENDPYESL